ncbi:hypothetical protein [Streptomyces lydicus]|uniref:hypothetical protein n=1 Tax=Streptomyces lydicus TaxID=47763 RepID=UPI0010137A15|nr:hypothetical protein [Streptomyces lydicus]MCZ1009344.1 hypothetical protein [Streptomyces lydicus]
MGNVMELPRGGLREPVPEPPAAFCAPAARTPAGSRTSAAYCASVDGGPPGRRPLCRFFRG